MILAFQIGSLIVALAVVGLAVRAGSGRMSNPDTRPFATTALLLTGISLAASVVLGGTPDTAIWARFGELVALAVCTLAGNVQFDYFSPLTLVLVGATLLIAANKRLGPRGLLAWSGLALLLIAVGTEILLTEPSTLSVNNAGAIVTGVGFAVLALVAARLAVAVG